jgi:hypothetical protein
MEHWYYLHTKMVTIHNNYVLCARWVLFVMPDSSSHSLLLHEDVAPSSAGDQLLILFPA